MRTTVHTDGLEGWAKRARTRAKALDEGKKIAPSKGITFESAAEMARLLTPTRIAIVEHVKGRAYAMHDLATALGRDVSAVRRDVEKLEKHGIVQSRHVANPGHGRIRMVSAQAKSIRIMATL